MKNIRIKLPLIVLVLFVVQACGPTEEEKRAKEQARMDSLLKVQQQQIAEETARLQQQNAENLTSEETQGQEEMTSESEGYTFAQNGEYAVQVGAFRSEEKAEGYIAKWSDRNYPNAYTVKVGEEEYGDVWFRVRVGFFDSKEAAEKLGAELAAEINSGYWVSKVK